MEIQFIPATEASVIEMCDCGGRAFADDALDRALFPRTHAQSQAERDEIYNFRVARLRKRIQSPEWRYVLATTADSSEGRARIVGYAGWVPPKQEKKESEQVGAEIYPKGMDMDVYKHAMEIIEKAKKEIIGERENRVWCKS
jgi:hypothetical protein